MTRFQQKKRKKSPVTTGRSNVLKCATIETAPNKNGVQTSTKTSGLKEKRACRQRSWLTSLKKFPGATESLTLLAGSKKHHKMSVMTPATSPIQLVTVARVAGPSMFCGMATTLHSAAHGHQTRIACLRQEAPVKPPVMLCCLKLRFPSNTRQTPDKYGSLTHLQAKAKGSGMH